MKKVKNLNGEKDLSINDIDTPGWIFFKNIKNDSAHIKVIAQNLSKNDKSCDTVTPFL